MAGETPGVSPVATRIFNAVLGPALLGGGLWSLAMPPEDALAWVLTVLLIVLGAEALLAAIRNRPSWLSRIGPLP